VTYEPAYQSINRLERFEAAHIDWFAHIEFRNRSAWGVSWRGRFWIDQYWRHIEIGAAL
jgi:hypothetical protein